MKKKIIGLIIVTGIAASGWYYWNEMTVDLGSLEGLLDDRIVIDNKEMSFEEHIKKIYETPVIFENEKPQASEQTKAPADNRQVLTQEQIKDRIISKYSDASQVLRNSYESRLSSLIEQAKKELLEIPQEDSISKYRLALKYLKAANGMEDNADRDFNLLLDKMKSELERNNMSTEAVESAKKKYEDEKQHRRTVLMQKVMETIKN